MSEDIPRYNPRVHGLIEPVDMKFIQRTADEIAKEQGIDITKLRPGEVWRKLDYKQTEVFSYIKEGKFRLSITSLFYDIVKLVSNSGKYIELLYIIVKLLLKGRNMFRDPKTTITAIVKFVVIVLSLIGINLLPEQQDTILQFGLALYALIQLIQGWFTKDTDKK
jgi:hypothetical protein